jgi:prophage regulatory protein
MAHKPKPGTKRRATRARKPKRDAGVALKPVSHELLLVDEVTTRARVSRWTLWRLEKAGRFPRSVKIGFKRIAWRAAEIDAYIAGNWVAPQAVAA